MSAWRDTTAAQLARLDMPSVRRRIEIATQMLGEGASVDAIQAATKLATGTAIGGSSLTRLRRQLKRTAAAKKAAQTRAAKRSATKPAPRRAVAPKAIALKPDTADTLALALRVVDSVRAHPKETAVRAIRAALGYLE